jgi:hypothetical protein
MATQPEPARKNEHEVLAPHRKKALRTLLGKFRDNTPEAGALWAVLYGYRVVDHETAKAVEAECSRSERTVGDVLDGWKPEALGEVKP